MRVLFVGLLYNPEREHEILSESKVGLSVASNQYQWNAIEGLKDNGANISIVGSVPLGSYPARSTKLYVNQSAELKDGVDLYEVGFVNLYPVKHMCRRRQMTRAINRWLSMGNASDEKSVIVFYDLYKPFIQIAEELKRQRHDAVKVCFIVPDLTGALRNDMGYSRMKQAFINITSKDVLSRLSVADGFVFLTAQMNDLINTKHVPYIVIDGIVDDEYTYTPLKPSNNERVIMYAGMLSRQYNIDLLLKSFQQCDNCDNLELWFCGKGDAESIIQSATDCDPRVKYFGFLPKEEIHVLEQNVMFYLNPRSNNGVYTKYSFPSKNLEYLLSGRPVIAFHLDGMSRDYDDIFLYMDESDELAFDNMFKRVARMSLAEIEQLGDKGLRFVKEHNGKSVQGRRLHSFLDYVSNC